MDPSSSSSSKSLETDEDDDENENDDEGERNCRREGRRGNPLNRHGLNRAVPASRFTAGATGKTVADW